MIENESEYLNFTEVVNDLLIKLHAKDRELILKLHFHEYIDDQIEFKLHIERFYALRDPRNPIYDEDARDLAEEVMDQIYKLVHNNKTEEN